MTLDLSLINQIESLRIPLDDPESPLDWKDWYHYILIHPKTGMRILVNITLMGRPQRGEIQVSLIINSPNYLLPPIPTNTGFNCDLCCGCFYSLEI